MQIPKPLSKRFTFLCYMFGLFYQQNNIKSILCYHKYFKSLKLDYLFNFNEFVISSVKLADNNNNNNKRNINIAQN